MLRVRVILRGEQVGDCDLVAEDPPMGVASGVFCPTAEFLDYLARQRGLSGDTRRVFSVEVRTPDGEQVASAGGAYIEDYSWDLPEEPPRLTIMGIDSTQFEAWFGADPVMVQWIVGDRR